VQLSRDLRDIIEITICENIEFILVVEKITIYNHLRRVKLHEQNNCLLMTRFGMADKRIRNFVRMLQQKISISMFDIADPNLYGLLIIKNICERIYCFRSRQFFTSSCIDSLSMNLYS
jgi:DNA topoisomerase VI subunit A